MTLLEPSVRVTADVYAYMFFCDFFNFLVVIFGFASFGVSFNCKNVPQYLATKLRMLSISTCLIDHK